METSFVQKISKYLLILLFAISIIIVVMFYMQVVPLEESVQLDHSVTSLVLTWAEVLLYVAIGLAVITFIWDIVLDPKKSISTGIAVIGMLIIAAIAYALSSDSLDSIMPTLVQTNAAELKGSDTGLFSLYIMLGLSFAAILWLEISSKLK